ncbi:unnamed protein product [Rotaria sp. Silwood2]|nr:unnamed protein product [Rotaria sp. Silwood2]
MFLVLVLILDSILLIFGGDVDAQQTITEYQLPMAAEAHEILYFRKTSELLITLRMPSTLVTVKLDKNKRIVGSKSYKLLSNDSFLHGLALSTIYRHHVWATFETANQIALINPK